MLKQVDREHYDFGKYSHKDRWVSYYHQLKEALNLKPHSILEVGVGDKVFGSYIKNNTSISYTSVDIAEDLFPDVVGSVLELPLGDDTFDIACSFEVLEHLPYEDALRGLEELARVSKKYVLISVPHFGPRVELWLKIPFLRIIKLFYKISYPIDHKFNGEHYWEIGKKGYSFNKFKTDLNKTFIIKKEFIPFESPYHHFFILEIK